VADNGHIADARCVVDLHTGYPSCPTGKSWCLKRISRTGSAGSKPGEARIRIIVTRRWPCKATFMSSLASEHTTTSYIRKPAGRPAAPVQSRHLTKSYNHVDVNLSYDSFVASQGRSPVRYRAFPSANPRIKKPPALAPLASILLIAIPTRHGGTWPSFQLQLESQSRRVVVGTGARMSPRRDWAPPQPAACDHRGEE
jgi:hypothetical protein